MEEEEEYDYLFKIILVGDAAAGKTCLMLRFCDDNFAEQHNPACGAYFRFRNCIHISGSKIKLKILDTHPPNRFCSLDSYYYQIAHGIIILHDPSQPVNNLKQWIFATDRYASESVPKMIVASKCDLANAEKIDDVAQLAAEHGIPFMNISAKDSINCEECIVNLVYENLQQIAMPAKRKKKRK